ncbi:MULTISPECIES: hypothetical protein [unclassified Prochlorococcus]|uniref:hypothetical protein n=1 Tax=unclassified Prochlorococcus TaxID=2627481 RepID=UPI00056C7C0E|nr:MULTISPECIES: hypothetical protein [unclassified Prochlorococcus]
MNSLRAIFNLLFSLIILISPINNSFMQNNQWIEVDPSKYGRQWWDKNSIQSLDINIIEIKTFYLPSKNKSYETSGLMYNMEIDCSKSLYRDIAINGMPLVSKDWEAANGDYLINETINGACSK